MHKIKFCKDMYIYLLKSKILGRTAASPTLKKLRPCLSPRTTHACFCFYEELSLMVVAGVKKGGGRDFGF
jgi:hypothetical protein